LGYGKAVWWGRGKEGQARDGLGRDLGRELGKDLGGVVVMLKSPVILGLKLLRLFIKKRREKREKEREKGEKPNFIRNSAKNHAEAYTPFRGSWSRLCKYI
jgi:hypothetical protein